MGFGVPGAFRSCRWVISGSSVCTISNIGLLFEGVLSNSLQQGDYVESLLVQTRDLSKILQSAKSGKYATKFLPLHIPFSDACVRCMMYVYDV